ncbi:MAG TPA: DUF998 domain-containing protein [Plantibacter sp.]|uniref:DUF998 domain-containing protein n=1 Tax=Plantibacter sp. TaxID=1871045 RepID=UPI002C81089A|nr:DUF998 domain-containing protein [Plantibacter sp.]
MTETHRRRSIALVFAGVGGALVVVATVMIWASRLSLAKNSYVSGLGATGEVTAPVFNAALLMVAVGGLSIAVALRRAGRRTPGVQRGPRVSLLLVPWLLIAASSLCFFAASQVTCTYECPIPASPRFTVQDAVHISFAVLGFALACLAMIGSALESRVRTVRRMSWFAGSAVALIAGAGGLLSLAEVGQSVGSWLEFVATTIALLWLVGYGLAEVLAIGAVPEPEPRISTEARRRQLDSASGAVLG